MSSSLMARPKANPRRSEAYRRAVASLPCALCGIEGYSQAAHPNAGKAKGMKASDDLCFPLCSEGGNGCHRAWDEYRYAGRQRQAEMEPGLAERTKQLLENAGHVG